MTATTTVAAVAAGAAAAVTTGAKEWQGHSTHRIECLDTYFKDRHGDDENNCDGDGGARGGEDKTPQNQHHHHSRSHHRLQSSEDEAAYKLVPPDGGWGWMVALGTFIIMSLLPMVGPCFGVLFSEYLMGEGSSSTLTAWIFNVQVFLLNAGSFLTWSLTQEFGWRVVALTGSMLAAAGLMISAFTPSPVFLFFSFSMLSGVGGGLVTCQCLTILPHYFERRRGLTHGIMMSGICMGQLMGPPLARFLQTSYGFRGATLIIGALQLNACVGASFFHPPEWHQKKVLVMEPQEDAPARSTKNNTVGQPNLTNGLVHSPSQASFPGGAAEGEIDGSLAVGEKLLEGLGDRRESCSSSSRFSRYNSKMSISFINVGSLTALPVEDEPEEEDIEEDGRRDILPVRIVRSVRSILGALRSLRVCLLCLADTLTYNGTLNFLMMMPFAMLESGFSLDDAALCISVSAGCNMATRFLVSALSDWRHSNSRLVYMCSFVIIAASIFAFPLLKSVEGQMVAMAVLGVGVGANATLTNIVIIDVVGLEHLSPVFGTLCLSAAVGSISLGPCIGFMRDVTQSYSVSMSIIGGMVLVGLLCWFFMGLAERVDCRREDGKDTLG